MLKLQVSYGGLDKYFSLTDQLYASKFNNYGKHSLTDKSGIVHFCTPYCIYYVLQYSIVTISQREVTDVSS